ncbi:hypothetical protein J8I87_07220 [Paraburkholderia sp. LEh10]|uniref:hypothetical protein n=1 Tax=Paraburkholderia sp. LEh10 TaxID=2821353 RepID=UPI001AE74A1E|nr:hypothetical protein [Paraburkholderia sp. LEh10]MBP0589511.1 hypothetical protein [Paraburkholderia sp. LEh10]
MNEHGVVAHLINDPVLAGEHLYEVVFDKAILKAHIAALRKALEEGPQDQRFA